jgi:hypothetical protein
MATKEVINVGIANEGEISLDVDIVKTWTPKNINYFGDVVFFKQDKTYYSMKRADFKRIFNL